METSFGLKDVQERAVRKEYFPNYIFVNNVDAFNGKYLVEFILDQKYGALPKGVTTIENASSKKVIEEIGEVHNEGLKIGSSLTIENGSRKDSMDGDSGFWDPENEMFVEFNSAYLTEDEYLYMITILSEKERRAFIKEAILARRPPPTPITNYFIIGTKRGETNDIPGIKMMVPKSRKEFATFSKAVRKCFTVIFDVSEDPSEIAEARAALDEMVAETQSVWQQQGQHFKQQRKFILLTSSLTWAEVNKSQWMRITERDLKARQTYPENYSSHVSLEQYVLNIGEKFPKFLKTYVVCCGIPYGYEENLLLRYFTYAWQNDGLLPVYRRGTKKMPLIHVQDLAMIVYSVAVGVEASPRYIFAVERDSNTQADNLNALAATMKISGIQYYATPESFRKKIYLQNQTMEFFMANLPIYPTYITKYMKINWKYGIPFKDNTDNIVLEYLKLKNYVALKIIIIGAPGVGKTKTAMLLRHLYGIHYLSVENVITAFLADLNSLIQEVRNLLAIESANKSPLHGSQPQVFVLKDICTLSKPLDKFIEIQYPFIEKRARAKTVKQLDLSTLERGRNYIIKEALKNNGRYLDITIAQMFHLRLKDIRLLKQGYVIDNYPKTAEQARKLFPEIPNSGPMKKDPMESEPERVNKESGEPRPDANKCVSQGVAQSSQIAIDFHPNTIIFLNGIMETITARALSFSNEDALHIESKMNRRFIKFRERISCSDSVVRVFKNRGLRINRLHVNGLNLRPIFYATIKLLGAPKSFTDPDKLKHFIEHYLRLVDKKKVVRDESETIVHVELQLHIEGQNNENASPLTTRLSSFKVKPIYETPSCLNTVIQPANGEPVESDVLCESLLPPCQDNTPSENNHLPCESLKNDLKLDSEPSPIPPVSELIPSFQRSDISLISDNEEYSAERNVSVSANQSEETSSNITVDSQIDIDNTSINEVEISSVGLSQSSLIEDKSDGLGMETIVATCERKSKKENRKCSAIRRRIKKISKRLKLGKSKERIDALDNANVLRDFFENAEQGTGLENKASIEVPKEVTSVMASGDVYGSPQVAIFKETSV